LPFEGQGTRSGRRWLWAGYGFSELDSPVSGEVADIEVVSLRLMDERFYHLDTCPLNGGYLLYYPQAFDSYSTA